MKKSALKLVVALAILLKKISVAMIAMVLMLLIMSAAHALDYAYTILDYPGSLWTRALGINNGGTIVGYYADANDVTRGFTLSGGVYTTVDYPGASYTIPCGINDNGMIVGYYGDGTGGHGFTLNGTNYTPLDYPGASYTIPCGINDNGMIVGYYGDGTKIHGFTTKWGVYTTVDYPGAESTSVLDINNDGAIVGQYYLSNKGYSFVRRGTTYTPLDYPGASYTIPCGINDNGMIVGYYGDGTGSLHGFALNGTTYTPLDYPGALDTYANDINDNGMIVGECSKDFTTHGFIATPVPTPVKVLSSDFHIAGDYWCYDPDPESQKSYSDAYDDFGTSPLSNMVSWQLFPHFYNMASSSADFFSVYVDTVASFGLSEATAEATWVFQPLADFNALHLSAFNSFDYYIYRGYLVDLTDDIVIWKEQCSLYWDPDPFYTEPINPVMVSCDTLNNYHSTVINYAFQSDHLYSMYLYAYSNANGDSTGVSFSLPGLAAFLELTVKKTGTGSGTIAATGLSCNGNTCSGIYSYGDTVQITANPDTGSVFAYWSGGCAGTTQTCEVTVTGPTLVTAHFVVEETKEYKLKVTRVHKHGADGIVTSNDGNINCGDTCSHTYYKDAVVTLSAVANQGSTFLGWKPTTPTCTGTDPCNVTIDKAKTIKAVFVGDYTLKVVNQSKKGGNGTVTSTPIGINCTTGNTTGCEYLYGYGEQITLSALADTGSVFVGWSPAKLCPGIGECVVPMDKKRTIKAIFSGP